MNYVDPIRRREDVVKLEKYLANTNKRDRLIFTFGINTGLRISDILKLDVKDVINKSRLTVREKKTNKYKQFPLNEKLQTIISEFINGKELDEPLFLGDKKKRMLRGQVYRVLNRACKEVGIRDVKVGTHTLRKTFGYHHYKQFNDVVLLQKILNHSSPLITLRYIGIEQEEIDCSYSQFVL